MVTYDCLGQRLEQQIQRIASLDERRNRESDIVLKVQLEGQSDTPKLKSMLQLALLSSKAQISPSAPMLQMLPRQNFQARKGRSQRHQGLPGCSKACQKCDTSHNLAPILLAVELLPA